MQFFIHVLSMIAVAAAFGGTPGGWSKADVHSTEVAQSAAFAVKQKYPDATAKFTTVAAQKQVL